MEKGKDYIFVLKSDINEREQDGKVTRASVFFTKKYLLVIPWRSYTVVQGVGTEWTWPRVEKFVESWLGRTWQYSVGNFEEQIMRSLPPDRALLVESLGHFSVKLGFWVFGSIDYQVGSGPIKSMSVPYPDRLRLKSFYGL